MSSDNASLLLVDDDPLSRSRLRRYLAPHGFTLTDAASGAEALDLIERGHFDLILLDVKEHG